MRLGRLEQSITAGSKGASLLAQKGPCIEKVLDKLSELTGLGPLTLILMVTLPVVVLALLVAARYKRRHRRD